MSASTSEPGRADCQHQFAAFGIIAIPFAEKRVGRTAARAPRRTRSDGSGQRGARRPAPIAVAIGAGSGHRTVAGDREHAGAEAAQEQAGVAPAVCPEHPAGWSMMRWGTSCAARSSSDRGPRPPGS